MENGSFSKSIVHDRLMEKWRYSSSSLEEFIHECCEFDSNEHVRRAEFYGQYKDWCIENGRRPFSKGKVKELLAANIKLGITHTVHKAIEVFWGIRMKPNKDTYSGLNPQFEKQYNEVMK